MCSYDQAVKVLEDFNKQMIDLIDNKKGTIDEIAKQNSITKIKKKTCKLITKNK